MTRDGLIARVFAFGRECNVNSNIVVSAGDLQAVAISFFNQRHDDLFRGSGVGRALEDDELSFVQMRRK